MLTYYVMITLTLPPYLFTYCFICLHHVTIAIFVYISEVKVRIGAILSTIIRSAAIIVYIIRHLFTHQSLKFRFVYTTWPPGARSAAIFVYILRHLFTYQRLNLGLFTYDVVRSLTSPPSMFTCDDMRSLNSPPSMFTSRDLWRHSWTLFRQISVWLSITSISGNISTITQNDFS